MWKINVSLVIWALMGVVAWAQTVGQVVKIDEPAGTITIKDASGQSVAYKPKDGLLFNAVKEGEIGRAHVLNSSH